MRVEKIWWLTSAVWGEVKDLVRTVCVYSWRTFINKEFKWTKRERTQRKSNDDQTTAGRTQSLKRMNWNKRKRIDESETSEQKNRVSLKRAWKQNHSWAGIGKRF